jgi:hypothetical protein
MKDGWRQGFAIEVVVALLSGGLSLLTLVWRDWIEIVLHVDPDGGSGQAEWFIAGGLLAVALALSLAARLTWRRHLRAAG